MSWRELETFSFGDSPALADELAALVLEGRKRATCWAAVDGMLTEVGKRMVMLDGAGRPRAVIETVELKLRHFGEVARIGEFRPLRGTALGIAIIELRNIFCCASA